MIERTELLKQEGIEAGEWGAAAEEHLWLAVIAGAIQEWLHGPLRRQREAEQYLFHDGTDFPEVCRSAGMDAESLRLRLNRFRTPAQGLGSLRPIAA